MGQKTFLPTKNIVKSKVNWVFTLIALVETPQVQDILGNVSPIIIPVLSALGIIARTFYTNTVLTVK